MPRLRVHTSQLLEAAIQRVIGTRPSTPVTSLIRTSQKTEDKACNRFELVKTDEAFPYVAKLFLLIMFLKCLVKTGASQQNPASR